MTRETKTIAVVQCVKLGQELPALDRPPFPGPLGQRIYDEISSDFAPPCARLTAVCRSP